MATAAPSCMTVAEFLAWDDGTPTRYELIDGQPVVMAPVRARHSRIVGNLAGQASSALASSHPAASTPRPASPSRTASTPTMWPTSP